MKNLWPAPQKFANFIFKKFLCPRSDIRRLLYFLSFIFILTPSLAGAAQVSLAWERSTGPDVAGYKMHYGNYGGSYQYTVNVGNSTSCTISGLNEGTTYYFAVTAYNTQQNESDYSNEVSHRIPDNPPPPPTETPNNDVVGNVALDISNLSNASAAEYQIVEGLADGNACFIDRSYTYSNVPDFLQGAVYIKTANNDKKNMADPLLSFDVNTDVTVYVAFDNRASIPFWLSDFTDTGYDLKTDVSFSIYAKDFPPGNVTLGPHGQSGSMYTVIIK